MAPVSTYLIILIVDFIYLKQNKNNIDPKRSPNFEFSPPPFFLICVARATKKISTSD